MNWQTSKIFLILGLMVPLAAHAEIAPLPLTLSANQAVKLQHIFPTAVTEKEITNANDSTAAEHLVWNKIPLKVTLPLNKERLISFPDNVQFGYDTAVLNSDSLSIQNVNGTVYLTAKKPFSNNRVFVQLKQTGELILLDLSAQPEADDTPLSVVLPSTATINTNSDNTSSSAITPPAELDFTELSRFAIQQLYAPQRLLTAPPGVYRVPMHTTRTVPLVQGDSVIAMPLISWRSGDNYMTAVMLRNRLEHSVVLDPRRLRGQWKTAAFFPQIRLSAAGNPKDSTTVFLISDLPFVEALGA